MKCAGYVLAGGGSTRLGQDKALIEFDGKPLLLRAFRLLESAVRRVTVVASRRQYAELGVPIIPDEWPGSGPLGGIVTALRHSALDGTQSEWNLILACDMPFVTTDWLAFVAQRATRSAADAVVPRSSTGIEPLCAAYRTSCAAALAASLDRGVRKIGTAIGAVNVEYIPETESILFDSEGQLFKNVNTAADLGEAQAAWKTKHKQE